MKQASMIIIDSGATGLHLLKPLKSENAMQVQVNTDRNIEGREALATKVQAAVERALGRLRDQITRVEVHLSDENGQTRGQNDKRCMVEARLEGRQPLAVTDQAATLDAAVDGAVAKMTRLIESTLGRGANSEAPRA